MLDPESDSDPAPPPPPDATLATIDSGRFSTFRYSDFRWLLFMQLASSMREPTIFITQSWYIAVAAPEGRRVLLLGVLSALRGLAFLAYALFGGTFADRFSRAAVLTVSHLVGLASILLIGGMLVFIPAAEHGDGLWLPVMLVLFASFGLINAQDQPTRTAMIRDSVPDPLLAHAITQHQLAMSLALLVAAPLAGQAIDLIGFGPTYLVASLGHLAVLYAVTRVAARPAADSEAASESIAENIRRGIHVLRADPVVRWTILCTWTVTALGLSVMGGLVAVWVSDILQLDAGGWGVMVIFWGIGGILASSWLTWRGDLRRSGAWFLVSCALLGVAVLGFGLSRIVVVAFLFNGLVGGSHQIVLTLSTTVIQRQVPNRLMGRVTGLLMLAGGIMQLAALLVGAIAQTVGIELVYPAAGILIIAFIAAVTLRQRPLRQLP